MGRGTQINARDLLLGGKRQEMKAPINKLSFEEQQFANDFNRVLKDLQEKPAPTDQVEFAEYIPLGNISRMVPNFFERLTFHPSLENNKVSVSLNDPEKVERAVYMLESDKLAATFWDVPQIIKNLDEEGEAIIDSVGYPIDFKVISRMLFKNEVKYQEAILTTEQQGDFRVLKIVL